MPWHTPPPAHEDSNLSTNLTQGFRDIPAEDMQVPMEEDLVKRYCEKSGRGYPLKGWDAAVSFSFFRLAVIMQVSRTLFFAEMPSSSDAPSFVP